MTKLKFADGLDSVLDDHLDSTSYKVGNVIELFHKHYSEFAEKLGDNEIEKIEVGEIGEGKGFCSQIFKITLTFNGQTQSFVAKVSSDSRWDQLTSHSVEIDAEDSKTLIAQMHNNECDAYELLKKIKRIPTPYCFYHELADNNDNGILLIEDVSMHGKSMDVFKSVTRGQCMDVARLLADFQAQLNFMECQSWRRKFSFNVQTTKIVDTVQKAIMIPALDFHDQEIKENIQVYVDMDLKQLARFTMEEYTAGHNTLVHADMWTNNLLIEFNKNVPKDKIACIIDWQICCLSNPMYDLCSFVFLCASADVRHGCEEKVIDYYYQELCRHYKQHNSKPSFTREQAREFYDMSLVQLVVQQVLTFSVHVMSLNDSSHPEDQVKCQDLIQRLRVAFKDAQPILRKYQMIEKFTPKKN